MHLSNHPSTDKKKRKASNRQKKRISNKTNIQNGSGLLGTFGRASGIWASFSKILQKFRSWGLLATLVELLEKSWGIEAPRANIINKKLIPYTTPGPPKFEPRSTNNSLNWFQRSPQEWWFFSFIWRSGLGGIGTQRGYNRPPKPFPNPAMLAPRSIKNCIKMQTTNWWLAFCSALDTFSVNFPSKLEGRHTENH